VLADFRERRSDYSILIFVVNDGLFLLKSFKFGVPAVLYHQPAWIILSSLLVKGCGEGIKILNIHT